MKPVEYTEGPEALENDWRAILQDANPDGKRPKSATSLCA